MRAMFRWVRWLWRRWRYPSILEADIMSPDWKPMPPIAAKIGGRVVLSTRTKDSR